MDPEAVLCSEQKYALVLSCSADTPDPREDPKSRSLKGLPFSSWGPRSSRGLGLCQSVYLQA